MLKLLICEPGSEEAAALWHSGAALYTCRLAYPEARAALAAARRSRRIGTAALERARAELGSCMARVTVLEIDQALAKEAGDLAESRALRGYDAVHLAAALALDPAVVVVSWDADLRRAAQAEGRSVAPG